MWRILARKLRWRRKPSFLKTSVWLRRLVERVSGLAVMQGPFEGLRYRAEDPGPSYMPQLLGTYEMELNDTIEELLKESFDLLVNAGAGVGYFAVGLAKRSKRPVIAYEAKEENHLKLCQLAERNGVGDLIEQKGICTAESLQSDLVGTRRPFLFMDVEGAEAMLLDLGAVPALSHSTILVETHDSLVPNITETLVGRFEGTHHVSRMPTRARSTRDLPRSISWPARLLLGSAMREHRGTAQTWLLMRPRVTSG